MKSLFFITFSISITYGQQRLEWVMPSTPCNTFVSSTATSNKILMFGEGTTILSSSNAGDSWENVSSQINYNSEYTYGFLSLNNFTLLESGTGYLSEHESIYKTTDGGTLWKKIASIAPYEVSQFHFVDNNNGWLYIPPNPASYKTTNGGVSWASMNAITENDGYITGFRTVDVNKIWLFTTYNHTIGSGGKIKYSSNGGLSWTDQPMGYVSTANTEYSVIDLKMRNNGLGIASIVNRQNNSNGMQGILIRTTDFGNTWSSVAVSNAHYPSILPLSDSVWIAIGNNKYSAKGIDYHTSILRSTNHGVTWSTVPFDSELLAPKTAQWLEKQKIVIAAGYYGVMYRSSDYGLTWKEISVRQPILFSMDFYNHTSVKDFGIGVGQKGLFLASTNNGTTWSKSHIPNTSNITFYCQSKSNNTILVGGTEKSLFKSTDVGKSWIRLKTKLDSITIQSGNSFFEIKMVTDHYWIVITRPDEYGNLQRKINDPSYVMITKDAGVTWEYTLLPLYYQATYLSIVDHKTFFIAGDNFTQNGSGNICFISRTTDGGRTWQTKNINWYIQSLVMFDTLRGVAGGGWGVYTTSDFWNTNAKVFRNDYSSSGVSQVSFKNDKEGLAICGTRVLKTSDGGNNWSDSVYLAPTNQPLLSMSVNALDQLFLGSDRGGFFSTISSTIITAAPTISSRIVQYDNNLFQNYPNPFNPLTTLTFEISEPGHVELKIFDIQGREIETVVKGARNPGKYTVHFNGNNYASGIYFYSLKSNSTNITKKMILLK